MEYTVYMIQNSCEVTLTSTGYIKKKMHNTARRKPKK